MKAIDIYNFRRKLEQTDLSNASINIYEELIDLKQSIENITSHWISNSLLKIKYNETDRNRNNE